VERLADLVDLYEYRVEDLAQGRPPKGGKRALLELRAFLAQARLPAPWPSASARPTPASGPCGGAPSRPPPWSFPPWSPKRPGRPRRKQRGSSTPWPSRSGASWPPGRPGPGPRTSFRAGGRSSASFTPSCRTTWTTGKNPSSSGTTTSPASRPPTPSPPSRTASWTSRTPRWRRPSFWSTWRPPSASPKTSPSPRRRPETTCAASLTASWTGTRPMAYPPSGTFWP
jgi:hypothetical protein